MQTDTIKPKKSCLYCKQTPQDILMLSCQHPICLSCSYKYLIEKYGDDIYYEQTNIEIECFLCLETTQIQSMLFKQIEESIHRKLYQKKNVRKAQMNNSISISNKKNSRMDYAEFQSDSYLNRMRQQYFKQQELIGGSSKQKQQPKYHDTLFAQQRRSLQGSRHEHVKKDKKQLFASLTPMLQKQQDQPVTIFCLKHQGYQLLYYCFKCQTQVCPECLLHGQHQSHPNKSFKQLFKHQLPTILNNRTEILFQRIQTLEQQQEIKKEQFEIRLKQINSIKEQSLQYYTKLRQTIEREETDVIGKCQDLLEKYFKDEKMTQEQNEYKSRKIMEQIEQVKAIKNKYQQYLSFNDDIQQRQQNQKALTEKYLIRNFMNLLNKFSNQSKNKETSIPKTNTKEKEQHARQTQILTNRLIHSVKTLRQSMTEIALPSLARQKYILISEDSHLGDTNESEGNSRVDYKNKKETPFQRTPHVSPARKVVVSRSIKKSPIRSIIISPYKNQKSVKKQKIIKSKGSSQKKNKNKQNKKNHCNQFAEISKQRQKQRGSDDTVNYSRKMAGVINNKRVRHENGRINQFRMN